MMVLACGVLSACGGVSEHGQPKLSVFAAASLRDVAIELGTAFERHHEVEVVFNFAGSNTLAQQIQAAPLADVFLSADRHWVAKLDDAGRTVPETQRELFGNRLVLIARHDAPVQPSHPEELASAGYRFLALADPEAVPAGRYARAALEDLSSNGTDVWAAVAGRVAPALDARAALALVESDPEILGIVYRTDALTSEKVRVLVEIPGVEDQPIAYWATQIANSQRPELGRLFLDFLTGPAAAEIVERHGFVPKVR